MHATDEDIALALYLFLLAVSDTQECLARINYDLKAIRADERQHTLQRCIEAMCLRCGKHEGGGFNPPTKTKGRWIHFYLTEYFECKAAPLHDLVAKEGQQG